MRDKWKEYETMREEQRKCIKLFSVWVIMKDGKKRGVITSRRAVQGNSSFVTVEILPKANIPHLAVYGFEHVRGLNGKECALEGVAKILIRNREKLKEHYGIKIPVDERALTFHDGWEDFMSLAGYDVIKAE